MLRTNFKQRAALAFLQMSARSVLTQLRFVNVSRVEAVKHCFILKQCFKTFISSSLKAASPMNCPCYSHWTQSARLIAVPSCDFYTVTRLIDHFRWCVVTYKKRVNSHKMTIIKCIFSSAQNFSSSLTSRSPQFVAISQLHWWLLFRVFKSLAVAARLHSEPGPSERSRFTPDPPLILPL